MVQLLQLSLQEILEYLKGLFELVTDIKEDVVTVAEAMRVIGPRIESPLPKLLKKVKDQVIKITICNDNKNIKAFGISKIELSDWIKTVNYKKQLSDNSPVSNTAENQPTACISVSE
ncbi:hypothetical protein DM558_12295 [Entomomonas moraniae]|uniref:Uncharacterized protein n=1 Tax=Entomomonas moraniae TaxID=2213226 RepID=A0A3Q9JMF7_9GAMM|nr:hypothetical protein [Entomomonas moraniae]AZS51501.1 hypothetical protein DM558_12295 [Entomomonas moraniae]